MKKFYFAVLLLLSCLLTYASNVGHFSKSVRQDNISTEKVSGYFGQWFSVAPGSTFEVVGDNTDPMGIRHISYQQYYQGVEVEGCLVLVHARNNTVQHVNGVLMETQLKPQSTVAKISKRKAHLQASFVLRKLLSVFLLVDSLPNNNQDLFLQ